ncbi:hypothetical protein ZWY2020_039724 [Hordeum vulgare]|nr:hypothetical protein ZWY2020_039724 [Hordeum vulgare]
MADEQSHKRPRGESSEHADKLEHDVDHAAQLDNTKERNDVQAHCKEPLYVLCTTNPEEAGKMIKKKRLSICGKIDKIIDVDVEYTREDEPTQRAAVVQLCLDEQVLVYHITAVTKMPKWLDAFLKEKMFTFVGFDSVREKRMLKNSGLEINPENFIDM